jgi:beta-lactamase regulating signal transducer with metallopeptidase domain
MTHALSWLLQNTLATALLAAAVVLVSRFLTNRPALVHALWLVVLVKFLTPSVVDWPLPAWLWPQWGDSSAGTATRGGNVAALAPAARELMPAAGGARASDRVVVPPDFAETTRQAETPGMAVDPAVAEVLRELSGHRRQAGHHAVESSLGPGPVGLFPTDTSVDAIPLPAASPSPSHAGLATSTDAPFWTIDVLWRCLLGAWMAGGLMAAVVQLRRILRHAALVRSAAVAPPHLVSETRRLAGALRVRPPRAVVSPRIESPLVSCLVWLRLVWPEALAAARAVERLRGVLAHELAHVRRRDHLVAWLELAAGLVWWWNPVFWLARKRLRESAEMACDALALSVLPEGRRAYAEAFLELSAIANPRAPLPALAARSGSHRNFERRLAMMLSERVVGKMSLRGFALVLLLAALALPSFSLGQAAPPRPDGPADPAASGDKAPAAFDRLAKEKAPTSPAPLQLPRPADAAPADPNQAAPTGLPRPSDDTVQADPNRAAPANRFRPAGDAANPLDDPAQAPQAAPPDKQTDVARLEARIERLEKLIQTLADRLERTSMVAPTGPSGLYVPAQSEPAIRHSITLADKQCFLFQRDGQLFVQARELPSGKPLWKTDLSIPQANITDVDSLTLSASSDRKLLVVSGKGDGIAVTVNIDAATGRIAQVSLSSSGEGSGEATEPKELPPVDSGRAGQSRLPGAPPYERGTASRPAAGVAEEASAGRAGGAEQVDLINLATAYIDAVGNVRLAKSRYQRLKEAAGAVPQGELDAAEVQLETAEKKLAVLTTIVSTVHDSAAEDLLYLQRMAAKGYVSDRQVAAARTRLTIVQSILKQGDAKAGEAGENRRTP